MKKNLYGLVSTDTKLLNIAFNQWVMSLINDDKMSNDVYQFFVSRHFLYSRCCKLCTNLHAKHC